MAMLRKDLAQLDLQLLGAKLKLRLGDAYTGSPLQGAVARLQPGAYGGRHDTAFL